MKLLTFEQSGRTHVGLERNGRVINVAAAAADLLPSASPVLGGDMLALLRAWTESAAALRQLEAKLDSARQTTASWSLARDAVRIVAPIQRPGKIMCSGINYRGHFAENPAAKLPEEPFFFAKMPSNVVGPGVPIRHPRQTRQLDYEVELAVVIGRLMQDTPETEVMSCIAGYTILHDVSARNVQFKDSQITLGKNFNTFCPLGPCIVTTDELPRPEELGLRSFVNGELRQNGTNRDWLFSLPRLLSFLSQVMALEPGDVVSTGTPAGVGLFRKPPTFLRPGDVVRLEIDGIGTLENPVSAA